MKIPDPERIMETLTHMVEEHDGRFYHLTVVGDSNVPEIQVLCPLCLTWCTADLALAKQEDEDQHEFMVPIGINMEQGQPYRPQLHVDLTAHVHDHECNTDHFIEVEEGSFGDN